MIAAKTIYLANRKCQGTTSQLGEKLIPLSILECFVTGHGFSRAANASFSAWALAPAVRSSGVLSTSSSFSPSCSVVPKGPLIEAGL
jgi:hypothetical protein